MIVVRSCSFRPHHWVVQIGTGGVVCIDELTRLFYEAVGIRLFREANMGGSNAMQYRRTAACPITICEITTHYFPYRLICLCDIEEAGG